MIEIYEKIRECSGVGLHGWYNSSVGVIRKPNSAISTIKEIEKFEEDIPKAEVKLNTDNFMAEETKKLLFFLPADSKWSRIVRRFVVVFLLAGLAGIGVEITQNSGSYIPAIWLPLVTSLLVAIDKAIREFTKE